jgi:mycothiol synthase
MLRAHLNDLPEVEIPDGYELRTYQPGDDQSWCDIMEGNVGQNWTVEKFAEKMSSDPRFSADGLFFATHNDQPVASACAWRPSLEEEIVGDVHMVGALDSHRGKGIGHLVNAAVISKLKDQGFEKAHLKTDDWRLPAINSYLKAGFQPLNTHISHAERWEVILDKIAEYENGR